MRRDRVAIAVAGEEHHRLVAHAAEGERAGGLAVGRARDLAPLDLHVRQLGESAAADDRKHSWSFRNWARDSSTPPGILENSMLRRRRP